MRARLERFLREDLSTVLVCAAACGADLLALEQARKLNIRFRVILPYTPAEFRRTSVEDRPGNWGRLFDEIVNQANEANDLVVLREAVGSPSAYRNTNKAIVSHATAVGADSKIVALVWEGVARKRGDSTAGLANMAIAAGFERRDIAI